jgi:hypothetical protein
MTRKTAYQLNVRIIKNMFNYDEKIAHHHDKSLTYQLPIKQQ